MTATMEKTKAFPPSADVVKIDGREYVIAPLDAFRTPPRKSIQERFRGFTGEYEAEAVDWGTPAGKEIW